jgi:hypothetical protein
MDNKEKPLTDFIEKVYKKHSLWTGKESPTREDMKTADEIIRQPKYASLKNLVLICQAMDEHASQYKSLEKEEEFIRLKEENNELTLSLQVANQGLDILYGVLERIKHEVDCNENMEFTSKLIDETLSVKEQ